MKISITGLVASLGSILLCCIFMFWNPYSPGRAGNDTVLILIVSMILPACLGVIASCLKSRVLMNIVFAWSLPYGLYLSIASIPSIFTLFLVVLILYVVAIIRMRKGKAKATL